MDKIKNKIDKVYDILKKGIVSTAKAEGVNDDFLARPEGAVTGGVHKKEPNIYKMPSGREIIVLETEALQILPHKYNSGGVNGVNYINYKIPKSEKYFDVMAIGTDEELNSKDFPYKRAYELDKPGYKAGLPVFSDKISPESIKEIQDFVKEKVPGAKDATVIEVNLWGTSTSKTVRDWWKPVIHE